MSARLPIRRAVGLWFAVAVLLGVALVAAALARGPLDDPDLAEQRPGFLDAVGPRTPAPKVAGLPHRGRPTVVFFIRSGQCAPLRDALRVDPLPVDVDTAVVVGGVPPACPPPLTPTPVTPDPLGRLAAAYAMPTPRDGGPPVGYAIVGVDATIRYRTLDPGVTHRLGEVLTMLHALPWARQR